MQHPSIQSAINHRLASATALGNRGIAVIASDPALVQLWHNLWVDSVLEEVNLREQGDPRVPVADTTTELLSRLIKRVDQTRPI